MAVKDRRFSLGVLTLAFILGFYVMNQSAQIVNEMEYSEYGIPLWKGSWREVPERYRVHLRLRGTLAMEEFPVPHFGPAPLTPRVPPPIWMDVGVLEVLNTGYERTQKKVFFWTGKRTNMVLEYDGLLRIGGVPLYAWNEAFSERHIIEVEGYAFDVIAEDGRRYHLFHVSKVNIKDSRESGTEPAWIKASKLSVNVANETPVVNITSQDLNRLPGLAKAIERVFEEEMMKKQGITLTPSDRIRKIPREQGIAIVRFLEGERTPEKTTYGFFVRYAGDVYSIYIQFTEQPQITS